MKERKRVKAKREARRFPGITRDAAELGVSRVHLWKVLTGRRSSLSLTRRYGELKGECRMENGEGRTVGVGTGMKGK